MKSGAGWTKSNEVNNLVKLLYNHGGFSGCVMYSHKKLSTDDHDTATNLYSYYEYFNNVDYTALTFTDIKINNNTEIVFDCDTLLLSVGLIPYIPLLTNLNCPIGVNKGPIVSEDMETMLDGFFVSGNALHVHDVVDYVTSESRIAGKNAARYVLNKEEKQLSEIVYDENISYVIPQLINKKLNDDLDIKFRVKKVINNAFIEIYHNDKLVHKEFHLSLIPSEMIFITLKKDKVLNGSNLEIKIKVR